jgi:hypothetical protein
MKKDYECVVKEHKNIVSYNIEKFEPDFMEKQENNQSGGINKDALKLLSDIQHEHIKNNKKYMIDKGKGLDIKKLSNIGEFEFFKVINNLYNNKNVLIDRLQMNDKYFVDLYNQFKKAYDELFFLTQINEYEINKYVSIEQEKYLRYRISSYKTLISCYCEKKNHKIFDKDKVKMHLLLTCYDEIYFTDFEKTQKLLEMFYVNDAKELGIDFQLLRDIFNVSKDREEKRKEKILSLYEDGNGGEINIGYDSESDDEEEDDNESDNEEEDDNESDDEEEDDNESDNEES